VSDLNELIELVKAWGVNKGITGPNGKGTIEGQVKKFAEEAAELVLEVGWDLGVAEVAITMGFGNGANASPKTKDSVGDTLVTLMLLCELYGITLEECLQQAYDEIKGRTGVIKNGTFIKDSP
jgi:NTP pyrophosphatase (non-canonical NTP hydrolase)